MHTPEIARFYTMQEPYHYLFIEVCLYKQLECIRYYLMGDSSVYLLFDIDGLDPSIAPGTGTPEIGGLNAMQVRTRS